MRFHWFLPTGGDGRTLNTSAHGVRIADIRSGAANPGRATGRPASYGYLVQLAQAAEQLGYHSVLTPTGAHCEDAWVVTAALIGATRRLTFLVALRPGLTSPVLAAQMTATFARLSGGRIALNAVIGSSAAEQRSYGDQLDHDGRYRRAAEFLAVLREALRGEPFDHVGPHYTIEGGGLAAPIEPAPPIYLGGSSDAAFDVTAEHADVFLTWGEPPADVAQKVQRARDAAAARGRTLRFGIRLHVITRDSAAQAWADADRLLDGVADATIAARQESLRRLESVGQRRLLDLHGGRRDRLTVAPNLWAGVGLVRGGAGTALVGSHAEVAERIEEYRAIGIEEFILSGYPHLEEAYAFAEGVMPFFPTG